METAKRSMAPTAGVELSRDGDTSRVHTERDNVHVTESREDAALQAESLSTLGVAEARAGRHDDARRTFARAVEAAEAAGDRAAAGRAALLFAEECGESLSPQEQREAFERAYELLAGTRDHEILNRLNECARRAISALVAARSSPHAGARPADSNANPEERWEGFSLKSEVLRYEAELIERALRDAGGVVSHAAKLLGFRHHQTFVALLNNRHKSLLHARNPVVPRRRSITTRARRAQPR